MKLNRLAAAALAVASFAAAHASDGTLTFSGSLTSSTCSVSAGSANQTVTLPSLAASTLASAGDTAGAVQFQIAVTGCSGGTATATPYFESGANVTTTGRLANTGNAGNVEIQLLNASLGVMDLKGVNPSAQSSTAAAVSGGSATATFVAKYYATGAASAGSVASSVTYSMVYQ